MNKKTVPVPSVPKAPLTKQQQATIDVAVKKIVKNYHTTLAKLAKT